MYFVARGVFSEAPDAQGAVAVKGADNLYVYDSAAGGVAFIGDLCSGQGSSGAVEDVRCPTRVGELMQNAVAGQWGRSADGGCGWWVSGVLELWAARCAATRIRRGMCIAMTRRRGRWIVSRSAKMAMTRTATTICSTRRSRTATGYGAEHDACRLQYEMNSRAISEDGSRIVFKSAEPLSRAATNGLTNVYEWHEQPGGEGRVSLISSGSAEAPVEDVVISPSGDDMFFMTTQGLVPQDTDGAPDVYDARLGGGFPPGPPPAKACAGDACQGPLTNPAPLLVPGSVSQAPGENFAAPVPCRSTKQGEA